MDYPKWYDNDRKNAFDSISAVAVKMGMHALIVDEHMPDLVFIDMDTDEVKDDMFDMIDTVNEKSPLKVSFATPSDKTIKGVKYLVD